MTLRVVPVLLRAVLLGALMAGAWAPAAVHAADPGVSVFMSECAECHSAANGKNKKGPSLFGVIGRPSATVPGYKYSKALRQAGWTWDEATLRRYLAQPAEKALPGTKMEYEGLDSAQVDAVIAYLRTRR
ncbi:cytochrome c family protein [Pseudoxanthomonas sp. UTMC 1351]|uniref:cytochrome c family protein n=1 Tax=Pseudoxanthomonas sp. UTMC 1351 TaxID=2695853 RepID=UPI0034CF7E74